MKIIDKIKELKTDQKILLMGVVSIGTGVIINVGLMNRMRRGDYYDVKVFMDANQLKDK